MTEIILGLCQGAKKLLEHCPGQRDWRNICFMCPFHLKSLIQSRVRTLQWAALVTVSMQPQQAQGPQAQTNSGQAGIKKKSWSLEGPRSGGNILFPCSLKPRLEKSMDAITGRSKHHKWKAWSSQGISMLS